MNTRNIIIDYVLSFQNETDLYTKESLEALPDENLIAISDRIFTDRRIEKKKEAELEASKCEYCGVPNCDRC